jgi:hypothetical protein
MNQLHAIAMNEGKRWKKKLALRRTGGYGPTMPPHLEACRTE